MSNAFTQDTPFARNYSRQVLTLDHGRGIYLTDITGNRYLDLGSGIAVNALGYGDRRLARLIARQARQVVHVSNLYATPAALTLGNRLLELAGPVMRAGAGAVHFGNSGAEANEGAIKYARLWSHRTRGAGYHRIISFSNAFHGRTMGALSATPKQAYRTAFEPLVPGFDTVPFNDVEALKTALDGTVAAIIVEVVQGEGGLQEISPEMVAFLNTLGPEQGVLVIADEVQTGLGRLGTLFGSAAVGLKPDIITLSKPLAGGLPLSATIIPNVVNEQVQVGDHGTTFGGGPVTSTAALYVLDRLEGRGFLQSVQERAEQFHEGIRRMQEQFPWILEIRGRGLLRGLQIDLGSDQDTLFPKLLVVAQDKGLLLLRSGSDVIRIAPPLIITEREMKKALELLQSVFETIESRRTT